MNKTFAILFIAFFAVCASFITWSASCGHKENCLCKWMVYAYSLFAWLCVIALGVITYLY